MGPKKASMPTFNYDILENLSGKVLDNRWIIGSFLGKGACAGVYNALQTSGNERSTENINYPIVVKIVQVPSNPTPKTKSDKDQMRVANTLNYEKDMYQGHLRYDEFKQRPQTPMRCYGQCIVDTMTLRYLVMEKLGCDLEEFAQRYSPSPATIGDIGCQILDAMQWLHEHGWLFIDVKPGNFMLTCDGSSNGPFTVKLIDFGLLERWRGRDGQHRPQLQKIPRGSPGFLSIKAHSGVEPSRRDDIESVGYSLLSLTMLGMLPWGNVTTDLECKTMKATCNIEQLSKSKDVSAIGTMIRSCQALEYEQVPPYNEYTTLLKSMKSTRKSGSGSGRGVTSPSLAGGKGTGKAKGKTGGGAISNALDSVVNTIGSLFSSSSSSAASPLTRQSTQPMSDSDSESELNIQRSVIKGGKEGGRGSIAKPSVPAASVPVSVRGRIQTSGVSSEPNEINQVDKLASSVRSGRSKAVASLSTVKATTKKTKIKYNSTLDLTHDTNEGETDMNDMHSYSDDDVCTGAVTKKARTSDNTHSKDKTNGQANDNSNVFLQAITGPHTDMCYDLPVQNASILVGRGIDSATHSGGSSSSSSSTHNVDIALRDDIHVSDHHCTIESKVDRSGQVSLRIRDEGSTNGTRVNGVKIAPHKWVKMTSASKHTSSSAAGGRGRGKGSREADDDGEFCLVKVGKTTLVLPFTRAK